MVANKTSDARNQAKRGIKAIANKMGDTGDKAKRGITVAVDKAADIGNRIKRGTQVVAGKSADIGNEVGRITQVAADKVIDTGSKITHRAQVTTIKVVDAGQEKLLDLKTFADQYLSKFSKKAEEASQRYTETVTNSLTLAGNKLTASTEASDPDGAILTGGKKAAVAASVTTAAAYSQILAASPAFGEFPLTLKVKFASAGLREAWRTIPAAGDFYGASVPQVVQNFGKDAVVEFLKGKHASHIKSVHNHLSLAMENGNIVWEAAKYNLKRGSADMTGANSPGRMR